LGTDDLLVLRTNAGVSGIVHGDVLPVVRPVFFTADDSMMEVLLVKTPDSREGVRLAAIATSVLASYAGLRLEGQAEAVSVEPVDDIAVAEALGVPVEELPALRAEILAPSSPEQP
jgi:hypothetical protein